MQCQPRVFETPLPQRWFPWAAGIFAISLGCLDLLMVKSSVGDLLMVQSSARSVKFGG